MPVHYAMSWLLAGALVLHIAVKMPEIRAHWSRRSPGTLALPEEDGADRRSLLTAVAAAVGAVTVTTVGQSFTPPRRISLCSLTPATRTTARRVCRSTGPPRRPGPV
ncbi:twin-arginine translocation signal domain-containing protein [Streptomyces europaeiscabiei]|nr:twin-arginine translocation signal domain-containing protein [Streptomyces europaeiscabiei]MDX3835005.1 twin-arginine translocation signal domain-containing protein [Streptomyces europaeiscabiei]